MKRKARTQSKAWEKRDICCPDCASKFFYFREKTKSFKCRKCGTAWMFNGVDIRPTILGD